MDRLDLVATVYGERLAALEMRLDPKQVLTEEQAAELRADDAAHRGRTGRRQHGNAGIIDQRFTELASHGDERANHFLGSLTRARTELDTLAAEAGNQDGAIGSLAERTSALRESLGRLADEIRDGVGSPGFRQEPLAARVQQLDECGLRAPAVEDDPLGGAGEGQARAQGDIAGDRRR